MSTGGSLNCLGWSLVLHSDEHLAFLILGIFLHAGNSILKQT